MAFIDLGNPVGFAVSGYGAEELAQSIDGVSTGATPGEYGEWFAQTRQGQVSLECGAHALDAYLSDPMNTSTVEDDFGRIVARSPGSGSM